MVETGSSGNRGNWWLRLMAPLQDFWYHPVVSMSTYIVLCHYRKRQAHFFWVTPNFAKSKNPCHLLPYLSLQWCKLISNLHASLAGSPLVGWHELYLSLRCTTLWLWQHIPLQWLPLGLCHPIIPIWLLPVPCLVALLVPPPPPPLPTNQPLLPWWTTTTTMVLARHSSWQT